MTNQLITNLAEFCEAYLPTASANALHGSDLMLHQYELQQLMEFRNIKLFVIPGGVIDTNEDPGFLIAKRTTFNESFVEELTHFNYIYLHSIMCFMPYEDGDGNIIRGIELRCVLTDYCKPTKYTVSFKNDCIYKVDKSVLKVTIDTTNMTDDDIKAKINELKKPVNSNSIGKKEVNPASNFKSGWKLADGDNGTTDRGSNINH